jgi:hypothetical protein
MTDNQSFTVQPRIVFHIAPGIRCGVYSKKALAQPSSEIMERIYEQMGIVSGTARIMPIGSWISLSQSDYYQMLGAEISTLVAELDFADDILLMVIDNDFKLKIPLPNT